MQDKSRFPVLNQLEVSCPESTHTVLYYLLGFMYTSTTVDLDMDYNDSALFSN